MRNFLSEVSRSFSAVRHFACREQRTLSDGFILRSSVVLKGVQGVPWNFSLGACDPVLGLGLDELELSESWDQLECPKGNFQNVTDQPQNMLGLLAVLGQYVRPWHIIGQITKLWFRLFIEMFNQSNLGIKWLLGRTWQATRLGSKAFGRT